MTSIHYFLMFKIVSLTKKMKNTYHIITDKLNNNIKFAKPFRSIHRIDSYFVPLNGNNYRSKVLQR